MKSFVTEDNKNIAVYDDLFGLSTREQYLDFCQKSSFSLGWSDVMAEGKRDHKLLYSSWSADDLKNFGIMEQIAKSEAGKELVGYKLHKTILNLTMSSQAFYAHAHPEQKVLLYYVNMNWEDGWHGETVFYDKHCKDIVFSSAFVPGRLCVFDGEIPHALRPQSRLGPDYRFTLSIFLIKE